MEQKYHKAHFSWGGRVDKLSGPLTVKVLMLNLPIGILIFAKCQAWASNPLVVLTKTMSQ